MRSLGGAVVARVDAATVLTAYIVVLLGIPAALRVAALGTAGAPSTMLAIGAFLWWIWYHLQREEPTPVESQPVRAAVLLLLLVMLFAYLHAMAGPLPGDELTPADSGLLKMMSLAGVVLVANEGIASIERHHAVTRRLILGIGLVGALAVVQYVTKEPWIDRITIPGLSNNGTDLILAQRNGFARPSGTSTHPIEFGVLLTMGLPLMIVYALHSPSRRWLYRILLGFVAFSIFLSISRSAILCGAVGMLVMALRWTWRMRFTALGLLAATFTLVYLTVPGLLGTITRLFTGISDDNSVASRTGSYAVAGQFIERSPWLGRGFGTFAPKYWILDNGYLTLLIEAGFLGLGALLLLLGTAAWSARAAVKRAPVELDREVAHALLAGICAGATAFAFFDMFAFPQTAGCFFLLVGLAGSMRRLTTTHRPAPVREEVAR